MPTPPSPPSPLLSADTATITFAAQKDGALRATYQGWEDARIFRPGEHVEVRVRGVGDVMVAPSFCAAPRITGVTSPAISTRSHTNWPPGLEPVRRRSCVSGLFVEKRPKEFWDSRIGFERDQDPKFRAAKDPNQAR